ncbi:hypothetical protein Bca4012_008719 [Brassica carinata]
MMVPASSLNIRIPLDNIDNGAIATESLTLSNSEDGLSVYRVWWEKQPSRFTHIQPSLPTFYSVESTWKLMS